ncbi:restriction endonuclease [Sphingomonas sp. SORGH_AS_0879]|uniref:restriction endonuclease n=1 Tax=Sphingomonas sp. SORGH_AS_0879 TaxID=3041790 RepID=UPI0027849947|nr:restriction endonuclease [Sphingomonas sp. SORGH_AS_0879]MDQ1230990.1 hypothetical protein [Sphingomonas sp. SORGH_AS_0879]
MSLVSLNDLSPTNFENLCFDIIKGMAFKNPVWRTPGADGGRDIEAMRTFVDPTFVSNQEKWFIECKRYESAVSWPTIHEKIAHAEALDADYLFMMTTSSASPTSIDRINAWNALNKRPKVRFWGGHEIEAHVALKKEILFKYGLGKINAEILGYAGVSLEMAKIISTVHSISQSRRDATIALEYANSLARCWNERIAQVQSRGTFFSFSRDLDTRDFTDFFIFPGNSRKLGRGEILSLTWILFVTERPILQVEPLSKKLVIILDEREIEMIFCTSSKVTVDFISGSHLYHDGRNLFIEEMKYE